MHNSFKPALHLYNYGIFFYMLHVCTHAVLAYHHDGFDTISRRAFPLGPCSCRQHLVPLQCLIKALPEGIASSPHTNILQ